jgi:hypothetical protein
MAQKARSTVEATLDLLLAVPESLVAVFERRSIYEAISTSSEKVLTVENISKIFHGLKRTGYIETTKDSSGLESVQFTNKAKLRVIDAIAGCQGWDEKYRLVSFDIPERMRNNRDKFRRAIKRIGFRQIQKSLWVCNRNVEELVGVASNEYGVSTYTVCVIADKTDIDSAISKMFK